MACRARLLNQLVAVVAATAAMATLAQDQDFDSDCLGSEVSLLQQDFSMVKLAAGASSQQAERTGLVAEEPPSDILITGATGATGQLLYKLLKDSGAPVRAFVRNVEKARDVLNCSACDASEGIFVGDIASEDPLAEAARGAGSLAIVTSAVPGPVDGGFGYPEGQYPVDVDWHGAIEQVRSFVRANEGRKGHVVLMSTKGTTEPNSRMDQIGDGWISFYKLNFEAFLMSSGLPFTIVKACGLTDEAAGASELVSGSHDVNPYEDASTIARGDVARVLAEALRQPQAAGGKRFDLCSRPGAPTADVGAFLQAVRW